MEWRTIWLVSAFESPAEAVYENPTALHKTSDTRSVAPSETLTARGAEHDFVRRKLARGPDDIDSGLAMRNRTVHDCNLRHIAERDSAPGEIFTAQLQA